MNETIIAQAIELTCYVSYIFDQMNSEVKKNLEEGSNKIEDEERSQGMVSS